MPVSTAPEAKESFWQRFKGTIELIGGIIAIIGFGIAGWQYFKPSEEKLPAEEQYILAHQYLEGNGTEKNVKRGGELLEMAAEKGHVKSMVELGMFAKEGKAGRKKDYGEALKWFELAAEEGDGRALCEIGLLYNWGHGVEEDTGKSLNYFRESAEKGDAEGQCLMGAAYQHGVGVVQNYAEALKWYRKAAEQGAARAQFNLGVMYDKGQGVKQDAAEAVKWYRKVAEQGNGRAQSNLGVIHYEKQDYVTAYVWCIIAAANTDAETLGISGFGDKPIYALKMTPAQIAQAEARAKKVMEEFPKLLNK